MFTGLIETTGVIKDTRRGDKSLTIGIQPFDNSFKSSVGESVAVNGVCLTVVSLSKTLIHLTAVAETINNTTFSEIRVGAVVNLERALQIGGRLDGHIVQGHVDSVSRIISDVKTGDAIYRTFSIDENIRHLIAYKGSVSIDGVSLTISDVTDTTFTVSIIPHTFSNTNMFNKKTGDRVNIECDLFARYIERQLTFKYKTKTVEEKTSLFNLLESNGF